MVEIIDNAVQLAVTLACTGVSGCLALKRRKQAYTILTCYYGALAMGNLYWLVYDLITSYTPKIFYISDLCWMASYLFLLMLVASTAGPEERAFRHPAAWISPVISTALTAFYCQWGDWVENIIWCGLMGVSGWFSIRGCIWASRSKDVRRKHFHLAVLLLIAMEYCLWTASCFWVSDTLANPYFWFDFGLSGSAVLLLIAAERAVGK
jgi:hypothetical protein